MTIQVGRLFHVNVNVTDMDRSVDFYRRLGFVVEREVERDEPEIGRGLGLPAYRTRVAFMKPRLAGDAAPLLDLVQFRDPPNEGSSYESANHVGICRLAFTVSDLDDTRAELDRAGIDYMEGPAAIDFINAESWTHAVPASFLTVQDPDGVFISLVSTVDGKDG